MLNHCIQWNELRGSFLLVLRVIFVLLCPGAGEKEEQEGEEGEEATWDVVMGSDLF